MYERKEKRSRRLEDVAVFVLLSTQPKVNRSRSVKVAMLQNQQLCLIADPGSNNGFSHRLRVGLRRPKAPKQAFKSV